MFDKGLLDEGCSVVMISALATLYRLCADTSSLLGFVLITAAVNVRQSVSSCFLFICLVREVVYQISTKSHSDLMACQLPEIRTMYLTPLKDLLGTYLTICLAALGLSGNDTEIKDSQYKFGFSMVREREGMADDPFCLVWSLVKSERHLAHCACTVGK